jgi:2-polyprenyl-3-methyl-5-hydroxy-6-metoxy-1,4-benzoquinol methylase
MLPDLSARAEHLRESMTDPSCSREKLFRTYREFALTNRFLAGWRRCYVSLIRPHLRAGEEFTLLDIGFGGGDIPRALAAWARHDGFQLEITGIEQDARALEYVSTLPKCDGVTFREASLDDLLREKRMFDFVTSNHVLHELTNREVDVFRDQVEALTRRCSIMNDVARSSPGYLLFASTVPLFMRHSFTVPDGLISIQRSFTRGELQSALGPRWRVRNAAWFRLIATCGTAVEGA